jgi:hypothetical protein
MTELRDTVVQLMPLILAVLALLIPTAAERLKNKNAPTPATPVIQGQTVDFSKEYVESVKERDARQEAELAELRAGVLRCTCGAFRDQPK